MKTYGNIDNCTYDVYDCQNSACKSSDMNVPGRNGRDIHNVLRNTKNKRQLRKYWNSSTRIKNKSNLIKEIDLM